MKYNTAAVSLAAIDAAFFFDVGSLYQHLETLTDRRDPKGVRYPLPVALAFIILAKLAGEQEPRGIAQWVALRKDLLREALHFQRHTTPAAITFSRILGKAIQVDELQEVISRFLLSAPEARQGVEINLDGKALRGTIPGPKSRRVETHHTFRYNQPFDYQRISCKRSEQTTWPLSSAVRAEDS